jgi:hypothetical protein
VTFPTHDHDSKHQGHRAAPGCPARLLPDRRDHSRFPGHIHPSIVPPPPHHPQTMAKCVQAASEAKPDRAQAASA